MPICSRRSRNLVEKFENLVDVHKDLSE